MASVTKKTVAVKPQRTMRYDAGKGLLTITDGVTSVYKVIEIGSQFGRGFRVTKLGTDGKPVPSRGIAAGQYDVFVSGNGQQGCDCPAGMLRGTCRHCEAIRVICDRGLNGTKGYPADGHDVPCDE